MKPTWDTIKLDLIFTDVAEYYEIPAILTPLSTSDHNVINWKSKCSIDRKVNTFLQITENIISEYFPQKTVRIYSKDKPFITSKKKPA